MEFFNGLKTVLLTNGSLVRTHIYIYGGACFAGEPTAYIHHGGQIIWVKPGLSVEFLQA